MILLMEYGIYYHYHNHDITSNSASRPISKKETTPEALVDVDSRPQSCITIIARRKMSAARKIAYFSPDFNTFIV